MTLQDLIAEIQTIIPYVVETLSPAVPQNPLQNGGAVLGINGFPFGVINTTRATTSMAMLQKLLADATGIPYDSGATESVG